MKKNWVKIYLKVGRFQGALLYFVDHLVAHIQVTYDRKPNDVFYSRKFEFYSIYHKEIITVKIQYKVLQ
jgi:hypothetical protein